MTPAELRELLPAVILGLANGAEREAVVTALAVDPALQAEYRELELVLLGLAASEPVTPPPALKQRLLEAARQEIAPRAPGLPAAPMRSQRVTLRRTGSSPQRRFWPLGLVSAGAVVLLAFLMLRPPGSALNASVVATTADGGLIYANSGMSPAPAVLIRPDRRRVNVNFALSRPAVFTDAVSSGGLSYLLDAGNRALFIVNEASGKLVDTWDVPAGAASVAVQGDTVAVKGAISGTTAIYHRTPAGGKTMLETRLAPSQDMPVQDIMDATLIAGNHLYATHHLRGEVSVLEVESGRKLASFRVGGAPVALALSGEALLVLDHTGRLLKLDARSGQLIQELKLSGTPDRLSVMDGVAYVSDRNGRVSAVNLEPLALSLDTRLDGTPMDLAPMPGGHLAVALSKRGVVVLNRDLRQLETLN